MVSDSISNKTSLHMIQAILLPDFEALIWWQTKACFALAGFYICLRVFIQRIPDFQASNFRNSTLNNQAE